MPRSTLAIPVESLMIDTKSIRVPVISPFHASHAQEMSLYEALTRHFPQEAFIQQCAPHPEGLRQSGQTPGRMQLAIFDIDAPKSIADYDAEGVAQWFDSSERPKLRALWEAHPGLILYRSRHGYRIIGALDPFTPESSGHWGQLYKSWLHYLKRAFGIQADALIDWPRLQRVPHDTRDDVLQDFKPLTPVDKIGRWVPELLPEDIPPLDEYTLSPLHRKEVGDEPTTVLGRAFAQAGLVIGKNPKGGWNVRCPLAHEHTGEGTKDRRTKATIFENVEHGKMGRFKCLGTASGHDQKLDPQYWLDVLKGDYGIEPPAPLESPAKPQTFKVLYGQDIFGALEPPVYFAEGVIQKGAITMMVGYGQSGKSWLIVDLAVAAATGTRWLDRFGTTQARTLYLDFENGEYEMRRRMQAVALARPSGTRADGLADGLGLCSLPSLYLTDDRFYTALEPLMREHELIIIDTLKAASPGLDENSSDMRSAIDRLKGLMQATGSTVVILAHSKKTSGTPHEVDARETGRGSSAIFDAVDTCLHVQYVKDEPLHISQTKSRLGKAVDDFEVTIEDGQDGAVHVRGVDGKSPEEQAQERYAVACEAVFKVIVANPGSPTRVVRELVGGRAKTVDAAIAKLVMDGRIENRGTTSAHKWYAVDEEPSGEPPEPEPMPEPPKPTPAPEPPPGVPARKLSAKERTDLLFNLVPQQEKAPPGKSGKPGGAAVPIRGTRSIPTPEPAEQGVLPGVLPKTWKAPRLDDLPEWPVDGEVGFDCETKDPHMKTHGPGHHDPEAYVVGVSLSIDGKGYYLPIRHEGGGNMPLVETLDYLRRNAKAFRGTLVGFNLLYDLGMVAKDGVIFDSKAVRYEDAMVADVLIDETHASYSLENVSRRWGFEGKDESELEEAYKLHKQKTWPNGAKTNLWRLDAAYVGAYAETDAVLPTQVLAKQRQVIEQEGLQDVWDLECRVLPIVNRMNQRGIPINRAKLAGVKAQLRIEYDTALAQTELVSGWREPLSPGLENQKTELEPLLRSCGVECGKTRTGEIQVDAKLLASGQHPVLACIARLRAVGKVLQFVAAIEEQMAVTKQSRVFYNLRQVAGSHHAWRDDTSGVRYGRMACAHINLQQIPHRDPELSALLRSVFEPEPGQILAEADFSSQEPRWLVEFAEREGCPGAREAADAYRANPRLDAHSRTVELTGNRLTRQQAKTVGLGLNYGMGRAKLAKSLGLPTEWVVYPEEGEPLYWPLDQLEAAEDYTTKTGRLEWLYETGGPETRAILEAYERAIPYRKPLVAKLKEQVTDSGGCIRTFAGRRLHFARTPGGYEEFEGLHKVLNRLIQGSAADHTKLALVALDDAGLGEYLHVPIHDSVLASVPDIATAQRVAAIMAGAVDTNVPAVVDVKTGPTWAELNDVDV